MGNFNCQYCDKSYREEDLLEKTTDPTWVIASDGDLWFRCECGRRVTVSSSDHGLSSEQALSLDDRSIFDRIAESDKLPYIPSTIMRTLDVVESESSSSSTIAETIREDPVLAGRIIEIANIRKSVSSGNISSLEHAISFIGRSAVTEVVMAAFLSTIKLETTVFSSKEFWESSMLIGCITEDLVGKYASDFALSSHASF